MEISKLLSKNEMWHRYKETQKEFFSNLIWDLTEEVDHLDGNLMDELHEKYWELGHKKHPKITELLTCTPWVMFLITSQPYKVYYANTSLYTLFSVQLRLVRTFAMVGFIFHLLNLYN
jgi:hypothetical protein